MNKSENGLFCKGPITSESSRTGENAHCYQINLDKTEEPELPEGYEWLPNKYFPYTDIPLPLVSKSWLNSFHKLNGSINQSNQISNENDSDNESDLSLSQLKIKLTEQVFSNDNTKPKRGSKPERDVRNSSLTEKVEANNELLNSDSLMVKRKRGRPRKISLEMNPKGNIYMTDQTGNKFDHNFWDDSDVSTHMKDWSQTNTSGHDSTIEMFFTDQESNYETEFLIGDKTDEAKISHYCIDCGKSFSALSTLKNHKRIHEGTLWECVKCRKGFTTKYLLKCHNRLHSGDLFKCQECDRGFITAELLKVHRRSHTGDRPFACHMCTKSFSSASNLSQHKESHNSEREYLCSLCGSSFTQKRSLDGHMLAHSEKNHICNVCGKLWARKSDLMEHMRVHTGVKPYSCRLCPQKFTQASSLKRHQRVHLDTKSIKCFTCSKMFKCPEYYKRHVKKTHQDQSVVNDKHISQ